MDSVPFAGPRIFLDIFSGFERPLSTALLAAGNSALSIDLLLNLAMDLGQLLLRILVAYLWLGHLPVAQNSLCLNSRKTPLMPCVHPSTRMAARTLRWRNSKRSRKARNFCLVLANACRSAFLRAHMATLSNPAGR